LQRALLLERLLVLGEREEPHFEHEGVEAGNADDVEQHFEVQLCKCAEGVERVPVVEDLSQYVVLTAQAKEVLDLQGLQSEVALDAWNIDSQFVE